MSTRDSLRTLINERLLARTPLRLTTRGLGRRPEWSVATVRIPSVAAIQGHASALTAPSLSTSSIEGARLLADPFLVESDATLHLFFEVQRFREVGHIHHAQSRDGVHWSLTGEVVVEPFHLSYPQVFAAEGQHWMLPESQAAGHLRLYRATSFPSRWEFADTLWPQPLADPTVLRYDGLWWLFGTDKAVPSAPRLRLLQSEDLHQGWTEHPSSPIPTDDQRITRSAGRPFLEDRRLWRLAQDGTQRYGGAVLRLPILELTPDAYSEGPAERLLGPSGDGWMSLGVHHLDLLERDEGFLVAFDGEGPASWAWRARRLE